MSNSEDKDWAIKCHGGQCGLGEATPFQEDFVPETETSESNLLSLRAECKLSKIHSYLLDRGIIGDGGTGGDGEDPDKPLPGSVFDLGKSLLYVSSDKVEVGEEVIAYIIALDDKGEPVKTDVENLSLKLNGESLQMLVDYFTEGIQEGSIIYKLPLLAIKPGETEIGYSYMSTLAPNQVRIVVEAKKSIVDLANSLLIIDPAKPKIDSNFYANIYLQDKDGNNVRAEPGAFPTVGYKVGNEKAGITLVKEAVETKDAEGLYLYMTFLNASVKDGDTVDFYIIHEGNESPILESVLFESEGEGSGEISADHSLIQIENNNTVSIRLRNAKGEPMALRPNDKLELKYSEGKECVQEMSSFNRVDDEDGDIKYIKKLVGKKEGSTKVGYALNTIDKPGEVGFEIIEKIVDFDYNDVWMTSVLYGGHGPSDIPLGYVSEVSVRAEDWNKMGLNIGMKIANTIELFCISEPKTNFVQLPGVVEETSVNQGGGVYYSYRIKVIFFDKPTKLENSFSMGVRIAGVESRNVNYVTVLEDKARDKLKVDGSRMTINFNRGPVGSFKNESVIGSGKSFQHDVKIYNAGSYDGTNVSGLLINPHIRVVYADGTPVDGGEFGWHRNIGSETDGYFEFHLKFNTVGKHKYYVEFDGVISESYESHEVYDRVFDITKSTFSNTVPSYGVAFVGEEVGITFKAMDLEKKPYTKGDAEFTVEVRHTAGEDGFVFDGNMDINPEGDQSHYNGKILIKKPGTVDIYYRDKLGRSPQYFDRFKAENKDAGFLEKFSPVQSRVFLENPKPTGINQTAKVGVRFQDSNLKPIGSLLTNENYFYFNSKNGKKYEEVGERYFEKDMHYATIMITDYGNNDINVNMEGQECNGDNSKIFIKTPPAHIDSTIIEVVGKNIYPKTMFTVNVYTMSEDGYNVTDERNYSLIRTSPSGEVKKTGYYNGGSHTSSDGKSGRGFTFYDNVSELGEWKFHVEFNSSSLKGDSPQTSVMMIPLPTDESALAAMKGRINAHSMQNIYLGEKGNLLCELHNGIPFSKDTIDKLSIKSLADHFEYDGEKILGEEVTLSDGTTGYAYFDFVIKATKINNAQFQLIYDGAEVSKGWATIVEVPIFKDAKIEFNAPFDAVELNTKYKLKLKLETFKGEKVDHELMDNLVLGVIDGRGEYNFLPSIPGKVVLTDPRINVVKDGVEFEYEWDVTFVDFGSYRFSFHDKRTIDEEGRPEVVISELRDVNILDPNAPVDPNSVMSDNYNYDYYPNEEILIGLTARTVNGDNVLRLPEGMNLRIYKPSMDEGGGSVEVPNAFVKRLDVNYEDPNSIFRQVMPFVFKISEPGEYILGFMESEIEGWDDGNLEEGMAEQPRMISSIFIKEGENPHPTVTWSHGYELVFTPTPEADKEFKIELVVKDSDGKRDVLSELGYRVSLHSFGDGDVSGWVIPSDKYEDWKEIPEDVEPAHATVTMGIDGTVLMDIEADTLLIETKIISFK